MVQTAQMLRLSGSGCKSGIAHPEQLLESASMKLLDDEIFVCERPECPDLVKHDNQAAGTALFPIDESAKQIVRVAQTVEAVGAVLNEYFPAAGWQLA